MQAAGTAERACSAAQHQSAASRSRRPCLLLCYSRTQLRGKLQRRWQIQYYLTPQLYTPPSWGHPRGLNLVRPDCWQQS
jgi:hypothetical protein